MSELTDAFEEALDAREEVMGTREQVTFRGVQLDALIQTQTDDFQPGAGGTVDQAPIRISLRKSDVTLPLEALEEITVRGKTLAVLDYSPLEGRIDFTVGDPATQIDE